MCCLMWCVLHRLQNISASYFFVLFPSSPHLWHKSHLLLLIKKGCLFINQDPCLTGVFVLFCYLFTRYYGGFGKAPEELGGVVGTWGSAISAWTSEGFYKNNSLTDNLSASSPWRPRVPFGEAAFLFQLHRKSQGWSLWVLIAFFPLFYQSAYSDEGKAAVKASQNINDALN